MTVDLVLTSLPVTDKGLQYKSGIISLPKECSKLGPRLFCAAIWAVTATYPSATLVTYLCSLNIFLFACYTSSLLVLQKLPLKN